MIVGKLETTMTAKRVPSKDSAPRDSVAIGKLSRRKGYLGENMFVKLSKKLGLGCRRYSYFEKGTLGDILMDTGDVVEVRNRKNVVAVRWFDESPAKYLAIKRKGERFMICMDMEDWAELMKGQ